MTTKNAAKICVAATASLVVAATITTTTVDTSPAPMQSASAAANIAAAFTERSSPKPTITVIRKRKATRVLVKTPRVVTLLINGKRTIKMGTGERTIRPAIRKLTIRIVGYRTVIVNVTRKKHTIRVPAIKNAVGSGSAASYKFLRVNAHGPVRWDPCSYTYVGEAIVDTVQPDHTIKWSYAGNSAWAHKHVLQALAQTSGATGWQFQQVQSGGDVQFNLRKNANSTRGLGGSTTNSVGQSGNEVRHTGLVDGWFTKSSPTYIKVGLIIHEIAHVLGLDHVNDKSQIMNPIIVNGRPRALGAGDLAGLAGLGVARGCVLKPGDIDPREYWQDF